MIAVEYFIGNVPKNPPPHKYGRNHVCTHGAKEILIDGVNETNFYAKQIQEKKEYRYPRAEYTELPF